MTKKSQQTLANLQDFLWNFSMNDVECRELLKAIKKEQQNWETMSVGWNFLEAAKLFIAKK